MRNRFSERVSRDPVLQSAINVLNDIAVELYRNGDHNGAITIHNCIHLIKLCEVTK